ncbi:MAG: penicillin-binding transpeptidase domain-containing protein [Eubacteriales bacterium]|nr:penicillin-binding transpeptidase domain-containing protein [Eubacteriales bacterium]
MLLERLRNLIEGLRERLERPLQLRIFISGIFFLALFGILLNNLYTLQVINGTSYNEAFIEKIERTVKLPGARGNIYDADGKILAYNRLSYNVIIADDGSYSNYNDRNNMLYRLAGILEKHEVPVTSRFEVGLDEAGQFYYTTSSDASRNRFIANVYGTAVSNLDAEDDNGNIRYPSDITAEEAVRLKASDYAFDAIKDENGSPVIPNDKTLLDMVKILYALRQTAFQRYETTTIAEDIDEYCMAEILENQGELKGVDVEENYIRRYNNAKYFSHIIGYTGSIQDDTQLKELQKTNSDYEITDKVGATGIEKSMEQVLQGKKGDRSMYVDSYGQVLEIISETEASAGHDLYLTIHQNLQIGVYHLLEQQLAGIVASKIVNIPASEIETPADASDVLIPADDAYFQFINNNILDTGRFFDEENRGTAEAQIAAAFTQHKQEVIDRISYELTSGDDKPLSELSNEYIAYMVYILDYLSKSSVGIVNSSAIDNYGDSYLSWKNDTISLKDYLYSGISEGWINVDKLPSGEDVPYQNADYIYDSIADMIINDLGNDFDFDKLIYKYMIIDKRGITGRLLCMALYEQGVLQYDEEKYLQLMGGDDDYAFSFLISKIRSIEITPAQLALDPCMGSVVITDVNTGEVRALVSYPGYDNNKINDNAYFNECLNNLSLPLINSATQTNKAPGSTLKPLSAIAVLEEHKISTDALVDCTGVYEEVTPNIKCWKGIPGHSKLTVMGAIENSCNYCFAEYGHRLSLTYDPATGEDVYSTAVGLEKLQKYLALFGFDRKSGIQIDEKEPKMSDIDPERSAFGQGTHSYNNVQLARYVTALANNGKLYNLTLLKRETDSDGNLIQEFPAELIDTIELSASTWNVVHNGLRAVITTGVASAVFQGYTTVNVAGKTGTAEEVKTRGNHGLFVSYAPYENPEIAVSVVIPFSYSSGNAARLARRVYDYYYGEIDLPTIISDDASNIQIFNVSDG